MLTEQSVFYLFAVPKSHGAEVVVLSAPAAVARPSSMASAMLHLRMVLVINVFLGMVLVRPKIRSWDGSFKAKGGHRSVTEVTQ
jgi:hypothetical protein